VKYVYVNDGSQPVLKAPKAAKKAKKAKKARKK